MLLRLLSILFLLCAPAFAQHNHERYHSDYENWSSRKTANCCNNQDCGSLSDNEVRQDANGTSVLIAGQWCPVLPIHLLTRGKSPDWTAGHACVRKNPDVPPCERLLCFIGPALH